MKNIAILIILSMMLFTGAVAGASVVTLSGNANPYELVYQSDSVYRNISTFEVAIYCPPTLKIVDVQEVAPFSVFHSPQREDGVMKLAGYNAVSPGDSLRTVFAHVYFEGVGKANVIVDLLSDDDLVEFTVDNQRENGNSVVSDISASGGYVEKPTTTSTSYAPTVTDFAPIQSSTTETATPLPDTFVSELVNNTPSIPTNYNPHDGSNPNLDSLPSPSGTASTPMGFVSILGGVIICSAVCYRKR